MKVYVNPDIGAGFGICLGIAPQQPIAKADPNVIGR